MDEPQDDMSEQAESRPSQDVEPASDLTDDEHERDLSAATQPSTTISDGRATFGVKARRGIRSLTPLQLGAVGAAAVIVLALVAGALASRGNAHNAVAASPSSGNGAPFLGATEGCNSTFWASHASAWEEYEPSQPISSIFSHAGSYASMTLIDALGGSASGEDARRALLREGGTAALNAANDSLGYPYARYSAGVGGRAPLIPTTNRLMTSGSDSEVAAFAAELAAANDLACPLASPAPASASGSPR
jgi:hypothetical protein